MDERFMRRALEIARRSLVMPGALPYAAVIVKDGQIVGEGLNQALANHDPTSHGEVEAIRDACKRLGTSIVLPTPLCDSASCFAKGRSTKNLRLYWPSVWKTKCSTTST